MTKNKAKEIIDLIYASNYEELYEILEEEAKKDNSINSKAVISALFVMAQSFKRNYIEMLLLHYSDLFYPISDEDFEELENYAKALIVRPFKKQLKADPNFSEDDETFQALLVAASAEFELERYKEALDDSLIVLDGLRSLNIDDVDKDLALASLKLTYNCYDKLGNEKKKQETLDLLTSYWQAKGGDVYVL